MSKEFSTWLILLILNILFICILIIFNSTITQLGILIYLPGLFFLSSSLFLRNFKGVMLCFITGLFLDTALNTPFGFHGIMLPIFQTVGCEWLKYNGNQNRYRQAFFQLFSNIFISVCLFLIYFMTELNYQFNITKFLFDSLISAIVFLPICYWYQDFLLYVLKFNSKVLN